MYEKEYFNEIPEVFKRKGGLDARRPISEATAEILQFMEGDAPYCMLTYDDVTAAKRAANTANEYAKKHHLGCKVSRRDEYVLFIKETA